MLALMAANAEDCAINKLLLKWSRRPAMGMPLGLHKSAPHMSAGCSAELVLNRSWLAQHIVALVLHRFELGPHTCVRQVPHMLSRVQPAALVPHRFVLVPHTCAAQVWHRS